MRCESSNNDEHKVTVVVTAYNQSVDLLKTLDSIQAQKSEYPIRILLVDDSSTDGTSEYLKNYVAQSSKDIYIFMNSKSHGSSKSAVLSAGARIESQYVMYISAGDYLIDERKLEESVRLLNNHPNLVGVASGYRIHHRLTDRWEDCMPDLEEFGTSDLIRLEGKKNLYTHNSAIVWRTLGNYHGRVYPKRFESSRMTGDVLLSICFLKFGDIRILPKFTSVYSVDGLGVWSSKSGSRRTWDQTFLFLRMIPLLPWVLKIEALKIFMRKLVRNRVSEMLK